MSQRCLWLVEPAVTMGIFTSLQTLVDRHLLCIPTCTFLIEFKKLRCLLTAGLTPAPDIHSAVRHTWRYSLCLWALVQACWWLKQINISWCVVCQAGCCCMVLVMNDRDWLSLLWVSVRMWLLLLNHRLLPRSERHGLFRGRHDWVPAEVKLLWFDFNISLQVWV